MTGSSEQSEKVVQAGQESRLSNAKPYLQPCSSSISFLMLGDKLVEPSMCLA